MKISTVHIYAKNPFILALMIVSILSTSFMNVQAVTSTNTANISKDDLFNAIYFLEGDLVQEIPALAKLKSYSTDKKSASDQRTMHQLSSKVDDIDPSFKQRLQSAVNSKDQYSISSTIKEGGELILIAGATVIERSRNSNFPDISKYNLNQRKDRTQASNDITAYYTSNPEVQEEYGKNACALLAIAIGVWLFLFVYAYVETPEKASTGSTTFDLIAKDKSLSHEKLVHQLTQLR